MDPFSVEGLTEIKKNHETFVYNFTFTTLGTKRISVQLRPGC